MEKQRKSRRGEERKGDAPCLEERLGSRFSAPPSPKQAGGLRPDGFRKEREEQQGGVGINIGLGRHLLPSHNALSSPSGLKQTHPLPFLFV